MPKIKVAHTLIMSAIICGAVGCEATTPDMEYRESESELHDGYEVWLLDQSNTNGLTYGGTIYIYDGTDLSSGDVSGAQPADVIDLGGATASLCMTQTAANPVRPHMVFFNKSRTHAIVSFVASGHVVIFDADTRDPLACFRMSVGAGGARQAHAAFPSRDETYIVVANQNGKALERIDTNYATNTFTHNVAATLDLANCTTPNGVACQAAGIRPDNAPICPIIEANSRRSFVTLRGGGLLVVDATTIPMSIVGEYDMATVHGNGCGGVQVGNRMLIDSGGGTATNLTEFDLYSFPTSGYSASNPPNTPAPRLVYSDDSAAFERDAHGIVATAFGLFAWVLDRKADRAEVFSTWDEDHVNTVTFSHAAAPDPAIDLGVMSPLQSRMFVSMRGPNPLSGDPHISTGSTPGMGVVQMSRFGSSGSLISVIPIHNIDAGGVERADAHGIAMRIK
jgi:hypothetical protein